MSPTSTTALRTSEANRDEDLWDLYRRLKTEGRLNLLCQLSERCASWLPNDTVDPDERPNVVPFISRQHHLAWREQWQRGRWLKLTWTEEERAAILRQDELFRQADLEWDRQHPTAVGPAQVLFFRREGALTSLWRR